VVSSAQACADARRSPLFFTADRPLSTGAAFLGLGTIFASLLAIGANNAAVVMPRHSTRLGKSSKVTTLTVRIQRKWGDQGGCTAIDARRMAVTVARV
jgi:hypothetical protein